MGEEEVPCEWQLSRTGEVECDSIARRLPLRWDAAFNEPCPRRRSAAARLHRHQRRCRRPRQPWWHRRRWGQTCHPGPAGGRERAPSLQAARRSQGGSDGWTTATTAMRHKRAGSTPAVRRLSASSDGRRQRPRRAVGSLLVWRHPRSAAARRPPGLRTPTDGAHGPDATHSRLSRKQIKQNDCGNRDLTRCPAAIWRPADLARASAREPEQIKMTSIPGRFDFGVDLWAHCCVSVVYSVMMPMQRVSPTR